MAKRRPTMPVLVVRSDGSVGVRQGEQTSTRGLLVVADCPACVQPATVERHVHRRWQLQTTFGYLVGDLGLTSRQDAHAAAAALGSLPIDWNDPALAIGPDASIRRAALTVLARWGLARVA